MHGGDNEEDDSLSWDIVHGDERNVLVALELAAFSQVCNHDDDIALALHQHLPEPVQDGKSPF